MTTVDIKAVSTTFDNAAYLAGQDIIAYMGNLDFLSRHQDCAGDEVAQSSKPKTMITTGVVVFRDQVFSTPMVLVMNESTGVRLDRCRYSSRSLSKSMRDEIDNQAKNCQLTGDRSRSISCATIIQTPTPGDLKHSFEFDRSPGFTQWVPTGGLRSAVQLYGGLRAAHFLVRRVICVPVVQPAYRSPPFAWASKFPTPSLHIGS